MDALILAGRKDDGAPESPHKLNNKSLLMINNIPMIAYVVDALKQAKGIENIVVIGPKDDLMPYIGEKVHQIVESTDSIIENIEIGMNAVDSNHKIIVLTSDIPLITGEMIDRFIQKCQEYEADLYYPFISKELILKRYPDTVRTYATLREGIFCGGNLAIFSRTLFMQNKSLLLEMYQKRKSILKYATILGLRCVVKYLWKSLTIKEIENRASAIVGFPVKGIIIDDPEIMIDLDKLSDYELISKVLDQKNDQLKG